MTEHQQHIGGLEKEFRARIEIEGAGCKTERIITDLLIPDRMGDDTEQL